MPDVEVTTIDPEDGWADVVPGDSAYGSMRMVWDDVASKGPAAGIYRVGELAPVPYEFERTETMVVLEGEARAEFEDRPPIALTPGAIVTFPAGTRCTWSVVRPFKNFFVLRD